MSLNTQSNIIVCENCDSEYTITIKNEKEQEAQYCVFCGEEAIVEYAPLQFED